MAIRFRGRHTVRVGPLRFRFTESGYTGWGIQLGRYRWNARTRVNSLDTPGWGGVRWGGKRRRRQ